MDELVTLADLALFNDLNARDAGCTDVFNSAPFLAALAATTATNGTTHTYTKETAAPVVGFRDVNTGRSRSKSGDEQVTVTLKVLDASFDRDMAVANAFTKGGAPAYMAREGKRHLRQAFKHAEEQIFYGADLKGFSSLASELGALAHDMVITGGGGTTSVWAVRTTADETDVVAVLGQDGKIDIEPYIQTLALDADGKKYDAYAQAILGWMGLQIGGAKSIARLANVGSLTDALMSDLFELFPEEAPPTQFVMNRHANGSLRKSRTATNATGQEAPYPTEWNGIPIITTSSVSNAETAVV